MTHENDQVAIMIISNNHSWQPVISEIALKCTKLFFCDVTIWCQIKKNVLHTCNNYADLMKFLSVILPLHKITSRIHFLMH